MAMGFGSWDVEQQLPDFPEWSGVCTGGCEKSSGGF